MENASHQDDFLCSQKKNRSTDEIDTNILIKTDDTAEPSTNTNDRLQIKRGEKTQPNKIPSRTKGFLNG